jgi:hypothetical protein
MQISLYAALVTFINDHLNNVDAFSAALLVKGHIVTGTFLLDKAMSFPKDRIYLAPVFIYGIKEPFHKLII